MKLAYTRGPWHRVTMPGMPFWTLGRISNHVAMPLPRENEAADWTLAEAAPDLYEAAKTALDLIEDLSGSLDGGSEEFRRCCDAVAQLGVAVLKAEGRPS